MRAWLPRTGLAARDAAWARLPWLLLGADASDVWDRQRRCPVDGRADRGDGGRESGPRRPLAQPGGGWCAAAVGGCLGAPARRAVADCRLMIQYAQQAPGWSLMDARRAPVRSSDVLLEPGSQGYTGQRKKPRMNDPYAAYVERLKQAVL